jgi:hypothetical protein
LEIENQKLSMIVPKMKNILYNKSDFNEFSENTYRNYKFLLINFEKYIETNDIYVMDINEDFFNGFIEFFKKKEISDNLLIRI